MPEPRPTNDEIADLLERIAALLEAQNANPFRVKAYRTGAQTVREAEEPLATVVQQGRAKALEDLPGIGEGLAATIAEYVRTGRSGVLERLQGEVSPAALLSEAPGISEEEAEHIAERLGVRTLEELEQAAYDGRLATVEGFDEERIEDLRLGLAGMLSRAAQRRVREAEGSAEAPEDKPDVATILDVDEEYRRGAEEGTLRRIAPKRFNPSGEAWLPVLETTRGDWHFSALFSNTARAHELGTTDDWVVIYYRREGRESQNTVVTGTRGALEGKRVVRGREAETRRYYEERGELGAGRERARGAGA